MVQPRVVHVIQHLSGGGAERQLLALVPHLQRAGVAASVITVYPSGLSADVREALPFELIDVARRDRGDIGAFARLVRAIRRLKPDIVHTHTHSGKYWGRLAAFLAGVRTIVHTEHSPWDERRSTMERLVDPWLHRLCAKVITFLPDQARMLSRIDRIPAEKISVVPNGLPKRLRPSDQQRRLAKEALRVSPGEFTILLIGRLEFPKCQALAIRAVGALEPEVLTHVRLLIAGTGNDEEALRALVHELGVGRNVRFLGLRNDMESIMPGADLVTLTSRFEGMPMVFIEAMFAGVPILSTPWHGSESMLGNGRYGFITPGWDVCDVASEIARAYRNTGARASMASRAYEHACERYDIANIAQAYRQLYVEICNKERAR